MLLSYGGFFFVLNQPSPGVDNRKKRTAARRFFFAFPG